MKLKETLLIEIFGMEGSRVKYSKSLLNLLTIRELEQKDNFALPEEIESEIQSLREYKDNFKGGVPLRIIEKYYFDHSDDLDHFVFLEYNDNTLDDIYIRDLFIELEEFYDKIYHTASLIAHYYSLEPKFKTEDVSNSL